LGSSVGSGNPVDQSVWTMAKVGLLCVALVHVGAQRQPLITVDLFSDTYDLLSDASSYAWKTAGVDEMIAKVPVDDLKKKILEQTGPVPPAVHENLAQAHAVHVQVKAAVIEHMGKAYEPLNQAAVGVIDGFERAVPSHKGMIPKTLGNFVLFVFYKACVLYVLLKVILTVLRMGFGITHCVCCCLCCCRCCRSASTKKQSGKKAGSANGKAANGKAAPAPSNKAAAKPAATKKK